MSSPCHLSIALPCAARHLRLVLQSPSKVRSIQDRNLVVLGMPAQQGDVQIYNRPRD